MNNTISNNNRTNKFISTSDLSGVDLTKGTHILDVSSTSSNWGYNLSMRCILGTDKPKFSDIGRYRHNLFESQYYPTFIKLIADVYHTDGKLVFIGEDTTLGQVARMILIEEAERFILSPSVEIDEFAWQEQAVTE